jgi:hypothetical protein
VAVALAGILIDRNREMPFNDLEKKRIENALGKFLAKRRPPPHIRKDLDIGYCLSGES